MAKQKNADDLAEIMSDQLDILTANGCTEEQIRNADSVANMIGKTLKLCALRISYNELRKVNNYTIETLEARKSK